MIPRLAEQPEALQRLAIGDRDVLRAAGVLVEAVLRPHARIVEPGRDAVRLLHLPELVLQEVRLRSVQHAGASLRQRRRVALRR